MKKITIIIAAFILATNFSANAQILNALTNMAKQEAGKKVNKVFSGDNRSEQQVENQAKQQANNTEDNSDEAILNLFNTLTDAENILYEQQYNFDAQMIYDIIEYDKDGKKQDEVYYTTSLCRDNLNAAVILQGKNTAEKNTFIFDEKNNVFIMLSDEPTGEKTGFVMGTEGERSPVITETNYEEDEAQQNNDEYLPELAVTYKKTGRSKKILGYRCYEYVAIDTENHKKHIAWTTTDVHFDASSALSRLNLINNNYSAGVYPKGLLMEYTAIDTDTNEKLQIKVTEFSEHKKSSINLNGYKLAKIGRNFKAPENE